MNSRSSPHATRQRMSDEEYAELKRRSRICGVPQIADPIKGEIMSRNRNYLAAAGRDWSLWQNDDGTWDYDQVRVALLMDIRGELRRLNKVILPNVAKGFQALAKIARRDEKAFKRRVENAVQKRLKRKA